MIHLWSRRQAVTVDFSSLMFLVAAHRQNVRRLQLKQLLILLLRMLIVALIALALARPFLTLGLPLASIRAKTDVVIVLDNSYSMGYRDVDGIWFEDAKFIATDLLKSLRHGDSAALILMSDIARPEFRQLTPDIESVIQAIQEAEVSYRGTNVHPSIELAHEILSDSQQQIKELYLISDFRQNGWTNVGVLPNVSGSRIVLLPVGQDTPHNTNIEEITASHQLIGVGLPIQLDVGITNHSNATLAQTTLTFHVGEEKKQTHTFTVDADEPVLTTITHNFASPGIHTGYFELTSDRLNVDNKRYFTLEVLGEIRVLCVGEQTDYLQLALNPLYNRTGLDLSLKSTLIHPVACTQAEFESFPLQDYDIVILSDVESLTAGAKAQLNEFIRQGKSIIAFVSTTYQLPWEPAVVSGRTSWEVPHHVTTYDADHPIFDIFSDDILSGQYGPKFYQAMQVTPAEDAKVLASFGDGTPFLIARREGRSHILFFNAGFDVESGDNELLINPFFLPLIQNTVLYSMYSGTRTNIDVGDTFISSFPDSSGMTAQIKKVDAAEENQIVAVPVSEDGLIQYNRTEIPGIYQVDMKTHDRLYRSFFAVNTPVSEADLTPFSFQTASEKINAQQVSTDGPDGPDELDTAALDAKRHGREIWGELLLLAACFMLLEGYLSNRASKSTPG